MSKSSTQASTDRSSGAEFVEVVAVVAVADFAVAEVHQSFQDFVERDVAEFFHFAQGYEFLIFGITQSTVTN